ncbi:hypothetical protein V8C86DRAFT_2700875 [Haematococcus lacustris]
MGGAAGPDVEHWPPPPNDWEVAQQQAAQQQAAQQQAAQQQAAQQQAAQQQAAQQQQWPQQWLQQGSGHSLSPAPSRHSHPPPLPAQQPTLSQGRAPHPSPRSAPQTFPHQGFRPPDPHFPRSSSGVQLQGAIGGEAPGQVLPPYPPSLGPASSSVALSVATSGQMAGGANTWSSITPSTVAAAQPSTFTFPSTAGLGAGRSAGSGGQQKQPWLVQHPPPAPAFNPDAGVAAAGQMRPQADRCRPGERDLPADEDLRGEELRGRPSLADSQVSLASWGSLRSAPAPARPACQPALSSISATGGVAHAGNQMDDLATEAPHVQATVARGSDSGGSSLRSRGTRPDATEMTGRTSTEAALAGRQVCGIQEGTHMGDAAAVRIVNSRVGSMDLMTAIQRSLPASSAGDLASLSDSDKDRLLAAVYMFVQGEPDAGVSLFQEMQELEGPDSAEHMQPQPLQQQPPPPPPPPQHHPTLHSPAAALQQPSRS